MGVRFPSAVTTTLIAQVPASGAETVVLTTPPLNIILDFGQVLLWWYIAMGTGTGTTNGALRLRRGTLVSSPVVAGGDNITLTASTVVTWSGCFVDTPGAAAGVQYSITLQGTGTTGLWAAGVTQMMLALSL